MDRAHTVLSSFMMLVKYLVKHSKTRKAELVIELMFGALVDNVLFELIYMVDW